MVLRGFLCVGGAQECKGAGNLHVFYMCFTYDTMPQSLFAGSLKATWDLTLPDPLCQSLKGAGSVPLGSQGKKGQGIFPKPHSG